MTLTGAAPLTRRGHDHRHRGLGRDRLRRRARGPASRPSTATARTWWPTPASLGEMFAQVEGPGTRGRGRQPGLVPHHGPGAGRRQLPPLAVAARRSPPTSRSDEITARGLVSRRGAPTRDTELHARGRAAALATEPARSSTLSGTKQCLPAADRDARLRDAGRGRGPGGPAGDKPAGIVLVYDATDGITLGRADPHLDRRRSRRPGIRP